MPSSLPPLDDCVRRSLEGPHQHFALRAGRIRRYPPAVARFIAYPKDMTAADWRDLATLVPAETRFTLRDFDQPIPDGVTRHAVGEAVQMTGENLAVRPDPDARELGPADVDAIKALVTLTAPGPFELRTIEMGRYLGLYSGGELVALAGERLHPPGWTEISAVCTHPDYRGQGLAGRLIRAVGAGIVARGEVPFLHAVGTNDTAISLYETLGFRLRYRPQLTALSFATPEALAHSA